MKLREESLGRRHLPSTTAPRRVGSMTAQRRFVDLSVPLENTPHADPPGMAPTIEYHAHGETAGDIIKFFPGLRPDQLPGGEGWAVEMVHLSTHNGTHVDAPYHYHSTMD